MYVVLTADPAGGGWTEAAYKPEGVGGQGLPAHELGPDSHGRQCGEERLLRKDGVDYPIQKASPAYSRRCQARSSPARTSAISACSVKTR